MKAASLRALVTIVGAMGMALTVVMPMASGAVNASDLTAPEASVPQAAGRNPGAATLLEINGAIGPATSRYVVRGIESAQKNGSRVVILEVDTPGGLDSAMRDIIRAILASPVPVVTYVSPPGARAASAGTYILYASQVAAMAPATNLGAATPVSIGGESPAAPVAPERKAPDEDNSSGTSAPPAAASKRGKANGNDASAMERKVVNDAVAYIHGLAELRGRNADWAEEAVRGAASLSATAALQQKVIEIIARDVPDLLAQLDGREVRVGDRTVKLATRDLAVERVKPDWRTQFLAVITNPTIAYGLMLVGIYGLLLEGYNPGAMLPGVVGTICLLLALFAFQILSVNYAGLALVGLGIGMIVGEFFFPTFGSLGLGGLVAFVVGSLILFDTDTPGMSIALPLIGAIAAAGGLAIVGIVYVAAHSMRRPVVTGVQGMIGANAEATEDFTAADQGRVRYGGELWAARTHAALRTGEMARIVKVEGLTLWVEPLHKP